MPAATSSSENHLKIPVFDILSRKWLKPPDAEVNARKLELLTETTEPSTSLTPSKQLKKIAELEQQFQGDITREEAFAEELDNTLLRAIFPDATERDFSFGRADAAYTTVEHLKQGSPEGHKLVLVSGSRLLFAAPHIVEELKYVLGGPEKDDPKNHAAYGSLFFGECQGGVKQSMNILVVDDVTGENGGYLANDIAMRYVADSYGQISPELARQLTDSHDLLIQHRIAILGRSNPETGQFERNVSIGKGTFTPRDLEKELGPYFEAGRYPGIDIILPLSSVKGGNKVSVEPGLITDAVTWVGPKTVVNKHRRERQSASQAITMFPEAKEDILNKIVRDGIELARSQADLRQVAALYCKDHEDRQHDRQQRLAAEAEARITGDIEDIEFDAEDEDERPDPAMYTILKAIVEYPNNPKLAILLEHQKVIDTLNDFVQKKWLDLATGKSYKFPNRSIAIAAQNDLREGEFYSAQYPEGAEVLFFRAPLLSSNGIRVAKNRYTPIGHDPDGNPFEGVVVVGAETIDQLRRRITDVAQRGLAQEWNLEPTDPRVILEIQTLLEQIQDKGREIPQDPDLQAARTRLEALIYNGDPSDDPELIALWVDAHIRGETTMEAFGLDFDGDTVAHVNANAVGFRQFAKAVKIRNNPSEAYERIEKEAKRSFPKGTTIEQIAIRGQNTQGVVGIINNQLTAIHSLHSEMVLMHRNGTLEEQQQYVQMLAKHYQHVLDEDILIHNPEPFIQTINKNMTAIVAIAAAESPLTQEQIDTAMGHNDAIYRGMIAITGRENQRAVDAFKSARDADKDLIQKTKSWLYRVPEYISEKKLSGLYIDPQTVITVSGNSMGEAVVEVANRLFVAKGQVQPRNTQEILNALAPEIDPIQDADLIAQAKAYTNRLNSFWGAAQVLSQKRQTESGPVLKVASSDGSNDKSFEITNLDPKGIKHAWQRQNMTLKLTANPGPDAPQTPRHLKGKPHKLFAEVHWTTQDGQPRSRVLGTVDEASRRRLNLQAGAEYHKMTGTLAQSQTEREHKLLMEAASAEIERFRQETMQTGDPLHMLGALWHVSKTRTQEGSKNQNSPPKRYPTAAAAMVTFPELLVEYLQQKQPIRVKVQGLADPTNELPREVWATHPPSTVNIQVRAGDAGIRWVDVENPDGEFIPFSRIDEKSLQLNTGIQAEATIHPISTTADVTVGDVNFRLGSMDKYDMAGQLLSGSLPVAFESKPVQKTYLAIVDPTSGKSQHIGELNESTQAILKAALSDWDENAVNLPVFQAVLKTSGEGKSTHINVTFQTPEGERSFSVNPRSAGADPKAHQYSNTAAQLQIVQKQLRQNNYFLTTTIGGQKYVIGRVNPQQTPLKKLLPELAAAGIKPDDKDTAGNLKTFEAEINSRVTTADLQIHNQVTAADLQIDASTLSWTSPEPEITETATSPAREWLNRLLDKTLEERPTLLGEASPSPTWRSLLAETLPSQSSIDPNQSTLRLAVHAPAAAAMQSELEAFQVSFLPISDDSTQLEEARGYTVFEIAPQSLPEPLRERLQEEYNSSLLAERDYQKTLKAIPSKTLREFEATLRRPIEAPVEPNTPSQPTDWHQLEAAPDVIFRLEPDEVFVFESNDRGIHSAGAALQAFGGGNHLARQWEKTTTQGKWAQWGVGRGHQAGYRGESYALATKPTPHIDSQVLPQIKLTDQLQDIKEQFKALFKFAQADETNRQKKFIVTPIGVELAGFSHETMASLLQDLEVPRNIHLPQKWLELLQQNQASSNLNARTQTNDLKISSSLTVNQHPTSIKPISIPQNIQSIDNKHASVEIMTQAANTATYEQPDYYKTSLESVIEKLDDLSNAGAANKGRHLITGVPSILAKPNLTQLLEQWEESGGVKLSGPDKGKPVQHYSLLQKIGKQLQKLEQDSIRVNFQDSKVNTNEPLSEYKELQHLLEYVKEVDTQGPKATFRSPYNIPNMVDKWVEKGVLEQEIILKKNDKRALVEEFREAREIIANAINFKQEYTSLKQPNWQSSMPLIIDAVNNDAVKDFQPERYENTLKNVLQELQKLNNNEKSEGRYIIRNAPGILNQKLLERLPGWEANNGMKLSGGGNEPIKNFELLKEIGEQLKQLEEKGIQISFQDSKILPTLSRYRELKAAVETLEDGNFQGTFRSTHNLPKIVPAWREQGLLTDENKTLTDNTKKLASQFLKLQESAGNLKFKHEYIALPKPVSPSLASPVQQELAKFRNRLDVQKLTASDVNQSQFLKKLESSNQELVEWLKSFSGSEPKVETTLPLAKQPVQRKQTTTHQIEL